MRERLLSLDGSFVEREALPPPPPWHGGPFYCVIGDKTFSLFRVDHDGALYIESRGAPSLDEVRPLVRALYATKYGGAGHCWHLVLDDHNIDRAALGFCAREAAHCEMRQCRALLPMLPCLSGTQLRKLVRSKHQ